MFLVTNCTKFFQKFTKCTIQFVKCTSLQYVHDISISLYYVTDQNLVKIPIFSKPSFSLKSNNYSL